MSKTHTHTSLSRRGMQSANYFVLEGRSLECGSLNGVRGCLLATDLLGQVRDLILKRFEGGRNYVTDGLGQSSAFSRSKLYRSIL